jgi:hypothetical protein
MTTTNSNVAPSTTDKRSQYGLTTYRPEELSPLMLYRVAQNIITRAERLSKKRKTDRIKPIEKAALRFCIKKHDYPAFQDLREAETVFRHTLAELNVTITFDRDKTRPPNLLKQKPMYLYQAIHKNLLKIVFCIQTLYIKCYKKT